VCCISRRGRGGVEGVRVFDLDLCLWVGRDVGRWDGLALVLGGGSFMGIDR